MANPPQPELKQITQRLSRAATWISLQGKPQVVPGFQDAQRDSSWAHGLKHYYWMALSKTAVVRKKWIASRDSLERELPRIVKAGQHHDGHWQNPNARMREDDPLVATAFAVIALSAEESYMAMIDE